MGEKHPVGLRPRWVWEELRYQEVAEAICRYASAGLPVPTEWVEELHELSNRMRIRVGNNT